MGFLRQKENTCKYNLLPQCRFAVAQGAVALAAPEPPGAAGAAQPPNADAASGHRLRVAVERVLCKASSQVRGVWRP